MRRNVNAVAATAALLLASPAAAQVRNAIERALILAGPDFDAGDVEVPWMLGPRGVLDLREPLHVVSSRDVGARRPQQHDNQRGDGEHTPPHLAGALLMMHAGLELQHVPYSGAAAGVAAVLGVDDGLVVEDVAMEHQPILAPRFSVLR